LAERVVDLEEYRDRLLIEAQKFIQARRKSAEKSAERQVKYFYEKYFFNSGIWLIEIVED